MLRPILAMLLFVSGAASGFYFDRWLHRPIVIQFQPAPHRGSLGYRT